MIKNEIRPLTGIRGIAALWVIFYHFESDITHLIPGLSVFHRFFIRGGLGVDIFFVLSGFIISNVYKIEKFKLTLANYWHFLVNRMARIYPNYLFCFLLLVSMVAASHLLGRNLTDPAEYPVSSIGWHLLMLQAWPLIPAVWSNWNAPAWSVSAEWFAYLFLFPASIWLASRRAIKKFGPALALALLVSFIFFGVNGKLQRFYFIGMITAEFLSGCLMYLFCLANPQIVKKLAARLDIVILFFAAIVWFWVNLMVSYGIIVITIPVIIVGLTQESSLSAKLLASSFFCYLGRVSYALYLVHAIAQRMLHMVVPIDRYAVEPLFLRLIVLLAYLIFPVFLAMGIYHLIEEPSRLFIRHRGNPKFQR